MMGRHHATTGLASIAATGALVTLGGYGAHLVAHPQTTALVALVAGAHFLRPDIDHPKAIASQLLGRVSVIESEFWREVSRRYYTATRASGDPVEPRAHRGLTHSPVGALLFGLLAAFGIGGSQSLSGTLAAGCSAWLRALPAGPLFTLQTAGPDGSGVWYALPLNLLGLALGWLGALTGWALGWLLEAAGVFPLVGIAVCWYCAVLLAGAYRWRDRFWWGLGGAALGLVCGAGLAADWAWVGAAAALGSYGHSLGDSCTTTGAPLRHPLREVTELGPQRWADHGTPRLLRFPTGSRRESFWVGAFSLLVGLLCIAATFAPVLPALWAHLG